MQDCGTINGVRGSRPGTQKRPTGAQQNHAESGVLRCMNPSDVEGLRRACSSPFQLDAAANGAPPRRVDMARTVSSAGFALAVEGAKGGEGLSRGARDATRGAAHQRQKASARMIERLESDPWTILSLCWEEHLKEAGVEDPECLLSTPAMELPGRSLLSC